MSDLSALGSGGVPLAQLLPVLGTAFVRQLVAPPGDDTRIGSVMLIDSDDLVGDGSLNPPVADLCLLVGLGESQTVGWIESLAELSPALRPRALMSKSVADSWPAQEAARTAGVALIAVHSQTRWESLLSTLRGVLDSSLGRLDSSPRTGTLLAVDTDLFGLAHAVASLTEGMVSIEDERSRMLAYSASDDAADELRKLSILGRVGPVEYLRRLDDAGVFERLRRTDEVIEVPADASLGIRRRLVVSIRSMPEQSQGNDAGSASRARLLGAVWLQEGQRPFAPDSDSVLRGAAAVAARLITRAVNAPTNEVVQIQRLLGVRGGGVDVGSLAAALSIPTSGPAVVIGFAFVEQIRGHPISELSSTLRLHASAFSRDCLVTTVADRIYVLIPRTQSNAGVTSWTHGLIERISARGSAKLRAAVSAPVGNLGDVAAARSEVDRVLDGTSGDQGVATLADSRTPVLLGEIMDLLAKHSELRDPRLDALLTYDTTHGSSLCTTVEAFLGQFGDVRRAAEQLHIHPNTLRYRVKRAAEILDIDLADPAGRLLLEVQLAVVRRCQR